MDDKLKPLEERFRNILRTKTYLDEKDGYFEQEVYVDYNDRLGSDTIKKIMDANNPRDAFYDTINDMLLAYERHESCDLRETITDNIDVIATALEFGFEDDDELKWFIDDWLRDNVFTSLPVDHFLNESINVPIIVDTGDGNYDFSCNNLFNYYRPDDISNIDTTFEGSSLIWLMLQQDYSNEQIKAFITNEDTQGSKFLKSVLQESENASTSMAALVFLTTMTLGELIDLNEKISKGESGMLIIDKRTECGLYDPWGGAGGVLEIELDKDVMVPFKFIDSALPDGARGYGVNDIYGLCQSCWEHGGVKVA